MAGLLFLQFSTCAAVFRRAEGILRYCAASGIIADLPAGNASAGQFSVLPIHKGTPSPAGGIV